MMRPKTKATPIKPNMVMPRMCIRICMLSSLDVGISGFIQLSG
jgi:hypothetical protein